MNKTISFLTFLSVLFVALAAACSDEVRDQDAEEARLSICYIGNEGFLISSPSATVLVDALFGLLEGPPAPGQAPLDVLRKMQRAEAPFDGISLALATHAHPDHNNPPIAVPFLESNTGAVLVTTPDAAEMVLALPDSRAAALRDRVLALQPTWGETLDKQVAGVHLRILGLRHADEVNYDMQHVAFLIELDGWKILHLGDALMTDENFAPFAWLAGEGVDVAFVPYWLLTRQGDIDSVNKYVAPKRIVPMHINASYSGAGIIRRIESLRDKLPELLIFRECLETRTLE